MNDMGVITSFLELDVYKESFQLSLEIEDLIKTFPKSEQYLLVDQMKRASHSIPAQIAEGYGRRESLKDVQRYLRDCIGETNEMINHILLSKHNKYISEQRSNNLIERYTVVGKKLYKLKISWQNFK